MLNIYKKASIAILLMGIFLFSEPPQSYPRLTLNPEYGFLAVLKHKIQFSRSNTYFNYKDGGQDVLFPVGKYSFDLKLNAKRTFVFLYQPLRIESKAILKEDTKIDNVVFSSGTAIKSLYNFPFFRASYLSDLNSHPFNEFAIGFSIQIRNATIEFESLNGEQFVSKRNIGPVPILKLRTKKMLKEKWWFGTDIDGFYAPISYLNGSDTEVIGAILDANLKFGVQITEIHAPYFNIRYIGGGAVGQSKEKDTGDGYTKNWLHFLTLQIGINVIVF